MWDLCCVDALHLLEGSEDISQILRRQVFMRGYSKVAGIRSNDVRKNKFLIGVTLVFGSGPRVFAGTEHGPVAVPFALRPKKEIGGGDRDAFWRRLLTIPFNIQIEQDKQIPISMFTASLSEELPGIFLWAPRGLYALEKNNGFKEAAAMLEMKNMHREESNPEAGWADMCLDIGNGAKTAVSILYQDYQEFCKRGGYRARNEVRFGREIMRWYRRKTGKQLQKSRLRNSSGLRECTYIALSLTVPIPESDSQASMDWATK